MNKFHYILELYQRFLPNMNIVKMKKGKSNSNGGSVTLQNKRDSVSENMMKKVMRIDLYKCT